MSISAAYLAVLIHDVTVFGAIFAAYLVATAWVAARRPDGNTGTFEAVALLFALGVAATEFVFGVQAQTSATGRYWNYPPGPYFVLASIAMLAVAFDLFSQPPAKIEAMLRRLGIDGATMHESNWRGAVVYVVGAARGDTTAKQIWVERDRLVPVRLLENTRQGRTDFRFNGYTQAGGQWVPGEIEQFVNGKRRLVEQVTQVRTNVSLPDALFDPKRFASAPRWTP
jgi:hypothetical protein